MQKEKQVYVNEKPIAPPPQSILEKYFSKGTYSKKKSRLREAEIKGKEKGNVQSMDFSSLDLFMQLNY
jgi:hypothetical protein